MESEEESEEEEEEEEESEEEEEESEEEREPKEDEPEFTIMPVEEDDPEVTIMPVEEEPEKPKPKPEPKPEPPHVDPMDPIPDELKPKPEPMPEPRPAPPEEEMPKPEPRPAPPGEEEPKPEPRPTPPVEEEKPEPKPEPKPEKKPVEVYDTLVKDLEEGGLEEILAQAKGKPVILDFQYDGCTPCQEIAPAFEDLMINNSDSAIFRKVDIFQHKDMLQELGVKSLPTFKMWVDGKLYDTKVGTDLEDLQGAISGAV